MKVIFIILLLIKIGYTSCLMDVIDINLSTEFSLNSESEFQNNTTLYFRLLIKDTYEKVIQLRAEKNDSFVIKYGASEEKPDIVDIEEWNELECQKIVYESQNYIYYYNLNQKDNKKYFLISVTLKNDLKNLSICIENDQPETEQPETDQPEIDQPETDQPETEQPETDQPEIDQPETDQPETDQPETDQPETYEIIAYKAKYITEYQVKLTESKSLLPKFSIELDEIYQGESFLNFMVNNNDILVDFRLLAFGVENNTNNYIIIELKDMTERGNEIYKYSFNLDKTIENVNIFVKVDKKIDFSFYLNYKKRK